MKVQFGDHVNFNRKGEPGTSVRIEFSNAEEGGWCGYYGFDTHGMSEAEIAATAERLHTHHLKKCARLNSFVKNTHGSTFNVAGVVYRVVDCTLRERAGEVELYVDVRELARPSLELSGFPIRQMYPTIDDVIDDAAIVGLARQTIQNVNGARQAVSQVVTAAKALIGMP